MENRQCSGRPETAKPKPNNLVQHSNRYVIPPLLPVETAAEIVTIVKEARKAKEVEAARREMMKRLLEVFFEVFLKGLPKSISKFQSIVNVSKRFQEVTETYFQVWSCSGWRENSSKKLEK